MRCLHPGELSTRTLGRSKPLLSYSFVEEESKIQSLIGLVCLQLMHNIIFKFTVVRTVCVPSDFAVSDEDVVLMAFVNLYQLNFKISVSIVFCAPNYSSPTKEYNLHSCTCSDRCSFFFLKGVYTREPDCLFSELQKHTCCA